MRQIDTVVEMLSEKRAGSKLKSISIKHNPHRENHSLITFVFEGGGKEDRHIGIYGEDLTVGFGTSLQ
jgi:hypothetical protein